MPKYYVESGTLREVVNADNEAEAVRNALVKCKKTVELGSLIRCNELGFDIEHPNDDVFFVTLFLLAQFGILDQLG